MPCSIIVYVMFVYFLLTNTVLTCVLKYLVLHVCSSGDDDINDVTSMAGVNLMVSVA